MRTIVPSGIDVPIVNTQGQPLQQFVQLLESIAALEILDGSGNPEGVTEARIKRLYLDTVAGVLYVKTIDGGVTGWVALN